jgi:group I intron endonuclease
MVIYKITNLINNKIYVGKDVQRQPSYYCSGIAIKNAIQKYGKDNFVREILEDNLESKEILSIREKYWISKLRSNTKEIGYNLTAGGEGGDTYTNNPNLDKIKEKFKGDGNPMFGRHHSEETKDIIRKKAQGRIAPNKGKFKIFVFIKDNIEIAFINGQHNAISYCKENNLPYSVLVKKLLPWNEYKCITKIN